MSAARRAAWALLAVAVVGNAALRVRIVARLLVDPWWRRRVWRQINERSW